MAKSWAGRKCPVCGEGKLHDSSRPISTDYRGEEFTAEQAGAFCDKCGDGIVYDDPTFDKKWDDFRVQVDIAQAAELAAYRSNLGITQEVASRLSGGGHNAFSRYEGGKAQPVVGVLNLFRILNRLLTENPAFLHEFVPEAEPLHGVFSATRSAAIDLARSYAYSTRPQFRIPILERWSGLKVAKEPEASSASIAAGMTQNLVSGVTILPDLNVSADRSYDVYLYQTEKINPWGAAKPTPGELRSHIHGHVSSIYGRKAGDDESSADEDVLFPMPLFAHLAKRPPPPVRTIKWEKPRKKAPAE